MAVDVQQGNLAVLFFCGTNHTVWNRMISANRQQLGTRITNSLRMLISFFKHADSLFCTEFKTDITVIDDLKLFHNIVVPRIMRFHIMNRYFAYCTRTVARNRTVRHTDIERYTHHSHISICHISILRTAPAGRNACIHTSFITAHATTPYISMFLTSFYMKVENKKHTRPSFEKISCAYQSSI